jgi:hypothetical protein
VGQGIITPVRLHDATRQIIIYPREGVEQLRGDHCKGEEFFTTKSIPKRGLRYAYLQIIEQKWARSHPRLLQLQISTTQLVCSPYQPRQAGIVGNKGTKDAVCQKLLSWLTSCEERDT